MTRIGEWRWPAAGGCLAAAAVAEAVLRAGGPGSALPLALVLDVSATLPLVLLRGPAAAPGASGGSGGHGPAAAATITVAAVAASLLHRGAALAATAALLAVWAVLARRRVLRRRAAADAADASRRAVEHTLLEHTARGERARIARELHDVVAHHISMISVQAETARLAVPGMPADGAERLLAIGDTARTALTEMRRLLGVLREDAGGPDGAPDRRPQPGLQQLLDLIDEARDGSGAAARLIVSGPVAALDPGVELTAYRIVQEALTNARRHAPGAAVDVELAYTGEGLRLAVRDNGPGPAAPAVPGGHGLPGMRERVAAVGGELRTGAGPVGGFAVEAVLPAASPDAHRAAVPGAPAGTAR
ncbi:sensor histidine kinase [Actinomadura sp. WMMB 499]|uniref:sensor histidine kinase n=1 Tax=Actinomadura sp. WMMB 499 TaxID=1219491 RepID=UPI001C3FA5A3|nr:sensor histidine kinase [Actinomadura sp. WMMB 499]